MSNEPKVTRFRIWTLVVASVLVTPILLLTALASGGIDHGNYALFVLLFPFASIAAMAADHLFKSTMLMILLAALQFPCYGVLLGIAVKRRRVRVSILGIIVVHALFVGLTYFPAQ
jgi:hypothetical protein